MRRLLVGIADQALSSATNVGLTIVVAHTAGLAELGAFGVGYAVYLILTGLSRALCSEPLLVRFSQSGVRDSTGMALVNGTVAALAVACAGLVLGGSAGDTLATLAVFLPGLLLKDAWRFVFIAAGRPERAVLNDAVWALGQVAAVGWILTWSDPGAAQFVAGWGAAATAAAAFGALQARSLPAPLRSRRWLSAHRDLLPGYTVDFAARVGGRQLAFLCVGALGGLTALGAIRAAEVVFGLLNVVLQSMHLIAIPQLAAAYRRSVAALRRSVTRLTIGLVALTICYAAAALLIPGDLGRTLLGPTWNQAKPVLLAEVVLFLSIAAITGPSVGLRALGDARRGASVRLLVVPLSVSFGAAGALLGSGPGAVYGLALANAIGLVLWLWQFQAALRPRPATAIPQPA